MRKRGKERIREQNKQNKTEKCPAKGWEELKLSERKNKIKKYLENEITFRQARVTVVMLG